MPSQISHIIAGEAALKKANPDFAHELLKNYGHTFRLGCQGPDIFYHNQRTMPSGLTYGVLLHKRNYGTFMQNLVKNALSSPLLSDVSAYVLGFSTHALYDKIAHPFIIYHSGWTDPSKPKTRQYQFCHAFYERILDIELLRHYNYEDITSYNLKEMIFPGNYTGYEFIDLIAKTLLTTYPSRTINDIFLKKRIKHSLKDTRYIYETTNPLYTTFKNEKQKYLDYLDSNKSLKMVSIVYPEFLTQGIDWANTTHKEWFHPSSKDKNSTKSYFDLTLDAENAMTIALSAIINCFKTKATSDNEIEMLIGNESLNLSTNEGLPATPIYMGPKPITNEIQIQYNKRIEWAKAIWNKSLLRFFKKIYRSFFPIK